LIHNRDVRIIKTVIVITNAHALGYAAAGANRDGFQCNDHHVPIHVHPGADLNSPFAVQAHPIFEMCRAANLDDARSTRPD
jgi:hypothetical protein